MQIRNGPRNKILEENQVPAATLFFPSQHQDGWTRHLACIGQERSRPQPRSLRSCLVFGVCSILSKPIHTPTTYPMARKAIAKDQIVKLIVGAGQASPSPPVGPALGSKGVKSIDFCKVLPSSCPLMPSQESPLKVALRNSMLGPPT